VDEGNDVRFIVNPSQRNNIKYYIVYRRHSEGPGLSRYDTIYSSGFETYTDPDVEANQHSYSYKFQTFEYCASPTPVDDLTVYTSLLLSATSRENDILLRWNSYHGHHFKNYTVMRKRYNSSWNVIAELTTETNTYSDSEDLCPDTYEYKVVATYLNEEDYHSESNKVSIIPTRNRFPEQIVDVTRSTIVDNAFVFTEWKAPEIAPEKIVCYEIWKSTDDSPFKQIDQVYPPETIYTDVNVDVNSHQYSYKIKTVNTCMVPTDLSNMGSSILLQKKTEGYQNNLYWTEDTGWEEGIQQYYLQRQNESGEWETIRTLDGNKNRTVIDLSVEE
jgi:hypothetical protein